MNKPTVIFVNGRLPLPLSVGGDGVSMHVFLRYLHKFGYSVVSIGSTKPRKQPMTVQQMRRELVRLDVEKQNILSRGSHLEYTTPYKVIALPPSEILGELKRLTDEAGDVVILTQLEMSPEISRWALSRKIPLIFFVHDAEPENLWTLEKLIKSPQRSYLIFNSKFTQNKFLKYTKGLKSRVIYPPIESGKQVSIERNGQFITMINPVKVKGGRIFLKVVRELPELNFLAVKVWYDPIKDGIHLSDFKNVEIWEKQINIDTFLRITRLLLVPSQWEEGFGRIAAEAMAAGVPVMASGVGGLKEAVRGGGILINNYKDPSEWVRKVKELIRDEKKLDYYSHEGTVHTQKFNAEKMSIELKNVIDELVSK